MNNNDQKSIEELEEDLKRAKLESEIKNYRTNNIPIADEKLFKKAKGIKTKGIVSLVLAFTIIGIFVTLILDLICGIQILNTNWKDKELEDNKTIWGILCFILLGSISSIIFGSKATSRLRNIQK